MLRPIEFRGKRADNGEWVYGWLIRGQHKDRLWYIVADIFSSELVPVNPDTIGQFTSLHDRPNDFWKGETIGQKVFEGDIIHVQCGESYQGVWQHDFQATIKYVSDGFYAVDEEGVCFDIGNFENSFKVIGNIHEDPSLLTPNP